MAQPTKNNALYLACLLGLVAPRALSAEWTTSAGVSPQIVYTDNVCLSPDDRQEDVYAVVTPRVSIEGSGNRANVSLSTSVDLNSLTDAALEKKGCGSDNRDRDRYRPRLNANADAVLVENWLFFDANANVSQNSVSPFLAGGSDGEDRRGNTNTTARYSVSPYVSRRFKNLADLLLRYTYDDQYNSKDVIGDSVQETVLFTLDSNPGRSKFSGGLQGNYSNVNYAETLNREDIDSELASAQINLRMQINRKWQVNGFYGEESNDFVSNSDEIDGDFWDAGLRWTPNSRTSFDIGTGDRFIGSTPRLSVSHRHKRSVFTADYAKTLTYNRNIRTLDDTLPDVGEPGQPTTLTTSPIVDERFSLGYGYQGRRSTLRVGASFSEQSRTLDDRNSTFSSVSISLSRPLSRQLSFSGGVTWSTNNPKGTEDEFFVDSDIWRANLQLSRPINASTSVSLNYQYTDRQSDLPANEYTENRVTLGISFRL